MYRRRLITILLPFVVLVLLEMLLSYPQWFYYLLGVANLAILVFSYYCFKKTDLKLKIWPIVILPLVLINSGWFYGSLITSGFMLQLLFLLLVLALYFYLKFCCLNFYKQAVRLEELQNLTFFLSFLAIFFATAALFGLKVFLSLASWVLIVWLIPLVWLTFYQMFWFYQIGANQRLIFGSILTLAMTEVAVSVSFLPLSYDILALLMAVLFYLVSGLTLSYLQAQLNRRILKIYIIFTSLSLLLIFLTSRWM